MQPYFALATFKQLWCYNPCNVTLQFLAWKSWFTKATTLIEVLILNYWNLHLSTNTSNIFDEMLYSDPFATTTDQKQSFF